MYVSVCTFWFVSACVCLSARLVCVYVRALAYIGSNPSCGRSAIQLPNMLRNLHITDLTPASGETYVKNRQWCVDQGATVYSLPVSLFDYRRMMCKDPDAIVPSAFDLIVCFGRDNFARADGYNSTVSRQYRFLLGSHQQLFMEALLAQDVNTTQIAKRHVTSRWPAWS